MRYFIIILITIASFICPTYISGQAGLEINKVFNDSYRNMKGVTETLVLKGKLRDLNLTTYHSMTIKGHPELSETIEKMVAEDKRKSTINMTRYKSGHIQCCLYRLPGIRSGESRYIMFLNGPISGDDRIIVVFLEGTATLEQVRSLLKYK